MNLNVSKVDFIVITHPWPSCKSKFNLKPGPVNLVAPANPIECLLYLPNVRAIQYKLGPERLTRLGNSNVLWLPMLCLSVARLLKNSFIFKRIRTHINWRTKISRWLGRKNEEKILLKVLTFCLKKIYIYI